MAKRAAQASMQEGEREAIRRSVITLVTKLRLYLGHRTTHIRIFGSFNRKTLLPRSMDPLSDVDLLVAFAEPGFRPQTYLDRLRRFVEMRYQRSEIWQDSPTIVLELNHIRFELVPALAQGGDSFLIPDGRGHWQTTEPFRFHRSLERRNSEMRFHLKPAIRLIKYWNALNDYPIGSYDLEALAVNRAYWDCRSVRDCFFSIVDGLPWHFEAEWKGKRTERARRTVEDVRDLQYRRRELEAELRVRDLIPAN